VRAGVHGSSAVVFQNLLWDVELHIGVAEEF
jgi:hypothetical protein